MKKTRLLTSDGNEILIGLEFNEFAEKYLDEEFGFKTKAITYKDANNDNSRVVIFTNQVVAVYETK
ncbi:MAG TPA: hypothetical protein VNU45_09290 [Rummeliibacillus sp.]|nr:hypothetical protein [Rummeliibacillus sp.]